MTAEQDNNPQAPGKIRASIGFIGGGNMAISLIGGLLQAGVPASEITVVEIIKDQQQKLRDQFGINVIGKLDELANCDVVILAVKPQSMKAVCEQLTPVANTLYISIAAGIRSNSLDQWLRTTGPDKIISADDKLSIVRCMPNTPSLLQHGAAGLYANDHTSSVQRNLAEQIMQAVGITIWVQQEQQLDAVTAISGSGPAYFFLMMEAMQSAAESMGLAQEVSRQLVLQTALGAAQMAIQSEDSPATLRAKVTSKGGTTEQAINSFQADGFEAIVKRALAAACERSASLSEELAGTDS